MCTRFVLTANKSLLQKLLGLEKAFEWEPRYNVAPSQKIPAAVRSREGAGREAKFLRWGFNQPWAPGGGLLVNARSEEIQNKPLFQRSFKESRCLIPMDGFYEWRHQGKETRAHFIHLKSKEPFAVAGIWAPQSAGGQMAESAVVLTTQANVDTAFIHDRMPVILRPQDFEQWLDPKADLEKLQQLTRPAREGLLDNYAVGDRVNNAANEGENCLEKYDGPSTLSLF